jgi:hypothetical protein
MNLLQITADLKETAAQLRRIGNALECLLAIQIYGEPAVRDLRRRWEPGKEFEFPPAATRVSNRDLVRPRVTQPTDEDLWTIEQQAERTRLAGLPPETTEPE